jgi:thiamine-phosphate pyrophosphorylase
MTDSRRLPHPLAALDPLPPGSAVILRHYGDPQRAALARRLATACRRRRLLLLIADDARLAAAVGADGIHLREAVARRGPAAWCRWRRPGWIVTAAAHSPAALFRAARAGADAALLAPVFATASHPDASTLGILRFAAWSRASPIPVYALGGVSAATARRLTAAGAAGFAGISGLADDPSGGGRDAAK